MNTSRRPTVWILLGCLVLAACEPMQPPGPIPKNPTEYRSMNSADRERHPAHIIVQYNLTRVYNTTLPLEERSE